MNHQEIAPAEVLGAAAGAADTSDPGSGRDGGTPRNHAVQFGRKVGMTWVPADTFRLTGRGTVRFDDGEVVVSGKRRRPFLPGVAETHRFDRDRIINVMREDKTVRFDVATQDHKASYVQFAAENAWAAEIMVGHLPQTSTPEFDRRHAENAQFHAVLDQLSPNSPVTLALVASNIVIFVAMCIAGVGIFQVDGGAVVRWGSNFGPLTMGGQWWRLFTAMFLHFGILHVALNMWALFQSGRMIERLYGSTRFLALYVFAGLAGSMASLLWNPQVNSAGASGAIFGIFGGLLAFVVNPRNGVPASIMAEQRNSTLLFAGYSLVYGFGHAGIDNAAHIGGLISGFAMGFLLARPLDTTVRRKPDFDRLALAAVGGIVLLGLLVWPLVKPSAGVRKGQQFQQALVALDGEESAAIASVHHLMDLGRTSAISTDEFAVRMRSEVLPLWQRPYRELAAVPLVAGDPQYKLQQALLNYLELRRISLETFAEAVARNDPALMQKATDARASADKALEDVKAIAKSD